MRVGAWDDCWAKDAIGDSVARLSASANLRRSIMLLSNDSLKLRRQAMQFTGFRGNG
jgi:hypothetical protein